jgi:hypothetical protein
MPTDWTFQAIMTVKEREDGVPLYDLVMTPTSYPVAQFTIHLPEGETPPPETHVTVTIRSTSAQHDAWVANGNCPAISLTNTWCSRRAGHSGDHRSPRTPNPEVPAGEHNPASVSWQR